MLGFAIYFAIQKIMVLIFLKIIKYYFILSCILAKNGLKTCITICFYRKWQYSSYYILNMLRKTQKNTLNTNLLASIVSSLVLTKIVSCQQPQNLIINGDFNMSDLNGSMNANFNPIPGWSCTSLCQIIDCFKVNQHLMSYNMYGANCTGYAVDLISYAPQNLTQTVTLEYEYYLLSLNYYYPMLNASLKTFQVYFNEEKLFSHTPNVTNSYLPFQFQKRVKGIAGVNTLRLTNLRNSGTDGCGFFVNNIRLTKITSDIKQYINNSLLSDFTVLLIKIPGSRIVFADFMGFFVNFDRLQFYYLHNRDYSQYSKVLLADINIINELKGVLFQSILEQIGPSISDRIDSFFASIDYKYIYTSEIILQRNESGRGMISNCYPFFVYTIPGTIVTYLFLTGCFKLVRKRPASRLIRKFSFFGILIPMIFEGNIESLTYYSFGEMTLFFSANFSHRFINVFIVFFQLIAIIVSVGSVLFFKYHYRRLLFYFIEDKRNNDLGVLCQTVDSGIICMLFGIAHQTLFSKPQLQLFVLLLLECAWMVFKLCLIARKAYKKSFSEFIMFVAGLVRMCFIITFYFYEGAGGLRTLINDAYHKALVIITLLLWAQELLISLFQFLLSIPKFFTKLTILQNNIKLAKFKKQDITQLNSSIQRIEGQTRGNLTKAKQQIVYSIFFKPHCKSSNKKPMIKGKVFNSQKVRIAHLKIQKQKIGGHINEK